MTDDDRPRCRFAVNPDANVCKPASPAIATHGNACPGHYAKVCKLYDEIPTARRLMLDNLAPTSSGGASERVAGTGDRQDALRVSALDAADALSDWLGWLPNLICADDDPLPLLAGLQYALDQAHRIVPWRTGRTHLPIQCPACFARTVYRDDGADGGYCKRAAGGCGRRLREADLAQLDAEHMGEVAYQLQQAARQRDEREQAIA